MEELAWGYYTRPKLNGNTTAVTQSDLSVLV